MSSSGTNSGRNCAGVIHGQRVFTGRSVTIMSPLAVGEILNNNIPSKIIALHLPNPSLTLPVDNSMVRRPGFVLFVVGISITAGGEAGDVCDSGWFIVLLFIFICTLSVVSTAAVSARS